MPARPPARPTSAAPPPPPSPRAATRCPTPARPASRRSPRPRAPRPPRPTVASGAASWPAPRRCTPWPRPPPAPRRSLRRAPHPAGRAAPRPGSPAPRPAPRRAAARRGVRAGRPSPHPVPGDVRPGHDRSRRQLEPLDVQRAKGRGLQSPPGLSARVTAPVDQPAHGRHQLLRERGATNLAPRRRARRTRSVPPAAAPGTPRRPPARVSARSTGRPWPARRRRYRLRAGSPRREQEERCAPRHPGCSRARAARCGSSPVQRTSGCSRPKFAPRPTPISSTCPRSPPTSSRLRRW